MMELKIIDRKALDKVTERIKLLLEKSRGLARYGNSEEWLDNQDVCQLLNISLRTLQSYRERGVLAYSMIGHKCYYKASDVHAFVEKSKR
ncbi:helix-turn-helix domain-containing protein [Dysgonomonas sp. Marseille-P4361]|uniref:helix-turn-helix domain-containing protein n=1 Tax=Dysgonomonas sp. Marseille-P4361 TaxID=2161820 RepID=UPI002101791A|nr:helix-turn-helix domain-containing protein [Dysgonomonas sp. Marseille-P4361]